MVLDNEYDKSNQASSTINVIVQKKKIKDYEQELKWTAKIEL